MDSEPKIGLTQEETSELKIDPQDLEKIKAYTSTAITLRCAQEAGVLEKRDDGFILYYITNENKLRKIFEPFESESKRKHNLKNLGAESIEFPSNFNVEKVSRESVQEAISLIRSHELVDLHLSVQLLYLVELPIHDMNTLEEHTALSQRIRS